MGGEGRGGEGRGIEAPFRLSWILDKHLVGARPTCAVVRDVAIFFAYFGQYRIIFYFSKSETGHFDIFQLVRFLDPNTRLRSEFSTFRPLFLLRRHTYAL